jgi:GNAT superfamily N-acetyltransferase
VAGLDTINAILEAAVTGWGLPARVLRLSLPSLRYSSTDLQAMRARLIADRGTPVGFSCTEPADPDDQPAGHHALMLHGLYVLPGRQRAGIGARLLADVEAIARAGAYACLTTRAWRESSAFFTALGFVPCEPAEPSVWPRPLWRALD